jgi:hypothetical protein
MDRTPQFASESTMSGKFRSTLKAALIGSLMMLGVVGSAGATYWQGDFDPLSFMGTAIFDIPTSCNGVGVFVPVSSCAPIDLISAVVTNVPSPPVTDQISFGFAPGVVKGVYWDPLGQLAGVDMYPPVGPSSLPTTGTWFGGSTRYYLDFFSGKDPTIKPPSPLPVGVSLYQRICSTDLEFCGPSATPAGTATLVTFRRVPEPGVLALMIVALAAGALVRRRPATSSRRSA